MLRSLALSSMFAAFATTAFAQTIVINPKLPMLPGAVTRPVHVSVGVSNFLPAPSGDAAQALKVQEDGRRMIYQLAANECLLLREALASDCRLESININVQYVPANQNFAQKTDGYNINGSINYQITPK
jgi:hypothetical protein